MVAYLYQGGETVLDRYLGSEQTQAGAGRLETVDDFLPVARLDNPAIGACKNVANQLATQSIVVGHQERPHGSNLLPRHGSGLEAARAQREKEGAPPARSALDPDRPAVQIHQPFGDGQPQPGSFRDRSRRGVHLVKLVENGFELGAGNTDSGVPNTDR